MMKVVQINTTCGIGSTGKIAEGISRALSQEGIENYILFAGTSNGYPNGISCSNKLYTKVQSLKSHLFGNFGFNSKLSTKKIIAQLERIHPDIVHLHNIHSHDCNLDMLFSYFKKKKTKLVWTFHDCWAFTGYCPHFTMVGCEKWKTECNNCPQYKEFSWFFDRSNKLFKKKKQLLSNLDLTIVTPSQWLAGLVKKSFLQNHPVLVINNGIDMSKFHPKKGDFREKNNITNKFIVLGVAFDWGVRKGLDVFINLSKHLNSDKFQIVLVGTNNDVDKNLPHNILSIHKTQNQDELAVIYSSADVFVNPTREDNFPTVNIEALACGTPVITFKTGGSPEIIDENTGIVCDNNVESLLKAINHIQKKTARISALCSQRAKELYNKDDRFNEYVSLYKKMIEDSK